MFQKQKIRYGNDNKFSRNYIYWGIFSPINIALAPPAKQQGKTKRLVMWQEHTFALVS